MTFREVVATEFARYRALTPLQLDQLEAHFELLVKWNAKLNLTRIASPEDAARLHYCESLYAGLCLPPGPLKIADIGSGAGFPGIPMAILRPECTVTLVESHQRKAVFLREASRELANVSVYAGRAEDLPGQFDYLVTRAVRPADVMALKSAGKYCLLIGKEDAEALGEPFPLPWGVGRYIVGVPRGTITPPV